MCSTRRRACHSGYSGSPATNPVHAPPSPYSSVPSEGEINKPEKPRLRIIRSSFKCKCLSHVFFCCLVRDGSSSYLTAYPGRIHTRCSFIRVAQTVKRKTLCAGHVLPSLPNLPEPPPSDSALVPDAVLLFKSDTKTFGEPASSQQLAPFASDFTPQLINTTTPDFTHLHAAFLHLQSGTSPPVP